MFCRFICIKISNRKRKQPFLSKKLFIEMNKNWNVFTHMYTLHVDLRSVSLLYNDSKMQSITSLKLIAGKKYTEAKT